MSSDGDTSATSTRLGGVRVMVIDDHALLAETLAAELEHEGCAVEVVRTPTTAAVLRAATDFRPDVVLLDMFLGPEVGTSIPMIGPLVAAGAHVAMLTGVTNEAMLGACVEAGAACVLPKSSELERVVEAVEHAARRERMQPVREREALLDRLRRARREQRDRLAPFERLTRREREVLGLLMEGRSAADIAQYAVVSLATVRSQIRAILQKLDVGSQLAAVALAHHAGWSAPGSERTPGFATNAGAA